MSFSSGVVGKGETKTKRRQAKTRGRDERKLLELAGHQAGPIQPSHDGVHWRFTGIGLAVNESARPCSLSIDGFPKFEAFCPLFHPWPLPPSLGPHF